MASSIEDATAAIPTRSPMLPDDEAALPWRIQPRRSRRRPPHRSSTVRPLSVLSRPPHSPSVVLNSPSISQAPQSAPSPHSPLLTSHMDQAADEFDDVGDDAGEMPDEDKNVQSCDGVHSHQVQEEGEHDKAAVKLPVETGKPRRRRPKTLGLKQWSSVEVIAKKACSEYRLRYRGDHHKELVKFEKHLRLELYKFRKCLGELQAVKYGSHIAKRGVKAMRQEMLALKQQRIDLANRIKEKKSFKAESLLKLQQARTAGSFLNNLKKLAVHVNSMSMPAEACPGEECVENLQYLVDLASERSGRAQDS